MKMQTEVDYNVISKQLTVSLPVKGMPTPVLAQLWVELCEELGVTQRAQEAPDDSEWFQLQWQRVQDLVFTAPN